MNTIFSTMESPIGTLTITANETAITGLYMEKQTGERGDGETGRKGSGHIEPEWVHGAENALILQAQVQLELYFAGDLKQFDLPLSAEGTEFQRSVWQELTRIPYGTTISYGELARRLGNSNGSRAVGLANGRNPISIIIPCHRVIGANGKLVGFGGGLHRKAWLLDMEQGKPALNLS